MKFFKLEKVPLVFFLILAFIPLLVGFFGDFYDPKNTIFMMPFLLFSVFIYDPIRYTFPSIAGVSISYGVISNILGVILYIVTVFLIAKIINIFFQKKV